MSQQLTFWITGAASGLGHALASAALSRGHQVCASDIDVSKLEQTAVASGWPRQRVFLLGLDVRDPGAWRAAEQSFKQRFARLDVMINNAGVMVLGPVHMATDQDVSLTLDVNVKGVMLGSRSAASLMLAQDQAGAPQAAGHIINIGSLSSLLPVPGLGIYSASKFAVRGYTLALALELKPLGIAVTCVNPDGIATPMLKPHEHSEHASLVFSGPRLLTAAEVAETVLGSVLERRPLEIILPASRGWLAKTAGAAPALVAHALKGLQWYGRRQQQKSNI